MVTEDDELINDKYLQSQFSLRESEDAARNKENEDMTRNKESEDKTKKNVMEKSEEIDFYDFVDKNVP